MVRNVYNAPCGELVLEVDSGRVCKCNWKIDDADKPAQDRVGEASDEDLAVMKSAVSQLDEYFGGKRRTFDLPLTLSGTPFRKKVWECLLAIPYGDTMTYGEIAGRCGCAGGQRAVAQACGSNRLAILVPCHRVVTSGGGLGGYTIVNDGKEKGKRPEGLAIKQYLLSHEVRCCGIPAAR